MQGIAGYFQIAQTKTCRKEPQRIRNKFKRQRNNTFNKIKNRFKCHFGIGCLQRGFMKSLSMTTRITVRTPTLATMIRRTTTMIMRRIFSNSQHHALK